MTLFCNSLLRVSAVAAFAAAAGLLLSSPALAHSELIASSPDDGEVLVTAPSAIVLTFAEDVLPEGSGIVVSGPDGKRYDIADSLDVSGTEASISLKPATAEGRYDVSYRIVSADGHVASGALTYSVGGVEAAGGPSATASESPTPTPASSTGEPDDGGSVVWVLGLGAIGIVLIAAMIAVFTRGRRG